MPPVRPLGWIVAAIVLIAPFELAVGIDGAREIAPAVVAGSVLATALIAVLVRAGRPIDGLSFDRVDALVGFWIVAVWGSVVFADSRASAAGFALRFTALGVIIVATRASWTEGERTTLARSLAIAATIGAAVGLVVLFSGVDPFERLTARPVTRLGNVDRLTRPWSHTNVAGMSLVAAAPAVLTLRNSVARYTAGLLVVGALSLTYSRGAMIGLGVAACVVIGAFRARRETSIVLAGIALAIGIVFAAPGWDDRSTPAWAGVDIAQPSELVAGQEATISVSNNTSQRLQPSGDDAVELSARWVVDDEDAGRLVVAEQTWPLPDPIESGRQIEFVVTPSAIGADGEPLPNGTYDILWDILQPDEAYYFQFSGRSAITSVRITDGAVETAGAQLAGKPLVQRQLDFDRLDVWERSLDSFGHRPWFGAGPGQLPAALDINTDPGRRLAGGHAHNIWIELLATTGLVGTVPFLMIVTAAVWTGAQSIRTSGTDESRLRSIALLAGLAGLLAFGMFDLPLMFQGTIVPFGVLLGLNLGSGHDSQAVDTVTLSKAAPVEPDLFAQRDS